MWKLIYMWSIYLEFGKLVNPPRPTRFDIDFYKY